MLLLLAYTLWLYWKNYGHWDVITAGASVASTIAIILTALAAGRALLDTRFFETVRFTIGIMEAPYVLEAVNVLSKFGKSWNNDCQWFRTQVEECVAGRPNMFTEESWGSLNRVAATYTFVAAIYARGLLVKEILFAKDALTIVVGFYCMEPLIRSEIKLTAVSDDILTMARDALKVAKARAVNHPSFGFLTNYTIN